MSSNPFTPLLSHADRDTFNDVCRNLVYQVIHDQQQEGLRLLGQAEGRLTSSGVVQVFNRAVAAARWRQQVPGCGKTVILPSQVTLEAARRLISRQVEHMAIISRRDHHPHSNNMTGLRRGAKDLRDKYMKALSSQQPLREMALYMQWHNILHTERRGAEIPSRVVATKEDRRHEAKRLETWKNYTHTSSVIRIHAAEVAKNPSLLRQAASWGELSRNGGRSVIKRRPDDPAKAKEAPRHTKKRTHTCNPSRQLKTMLTRQKAVFDSKGVVVPLENFLSEQLSAADRATMLDYVHEYHQIPAQVQAAWQEKWQDVFDPKKRASIVRYLDLPQDGFLAELTMQEAMKAENDFFVQVGKTISRLCHLWLAHREEGGTTSLADYLSCLQTEERDNQLVGLPEQMQTYVEHYARQNGQAVWQRHLERKAREAEEEARAEARRQNRLPETPTVARSKRSTPFRPRHAGAATCRIDHAYDPGVINADEALAWLDHAGSHERNWERYQVHAAEQQNSPLDWVLEAQPKLPGRVLPKGGTPNAPVSRFVSNEVVQASSNLRERDNVPRAEFLRQDDGDAKSWVKSKTATQRALDTTGLSGPLRNNPSREKDSRFSSSRWGMRAAFGR